MRERFVHITFHKRVGDSLAASLGCSVEALQPGWRLVTPFRDQAHLTGLLVQLDSLNLPYHHVHITDPIAETSHR